MAATFQATGQQIRNHGQGQFGRFFRGTVELNGSLGHALDASHDYERFSRLSDEQLAARGLTRETLPQHVFDKHFSG